MTSLGPNVAAPVFSVELKPKWGMLSQSNMAHAVKQKICRYCMHQQLKKKQGKYCPMDLYSQDAQRVWFGLEQLTDHPHNNMRLFVNGKLVWSGEQYEKYVIVMQFVEK